MAKLTKLCEYGDCNIMSSLAHGGVSLNFRGEERPFFCGAVHASLWLLKREGHKNIVQSVEAKLSRK